MARREAEQGARLWGQFLGEEGTDVSLEVPPWSLGPTSGLAAV